MTTHRLRERVSGVARWSGFGLAGICLLALVLPACKGTNSQRSEQDSGTGSSQPRTDARLDAKPASQDAAPTKVCKEGSRTSSKDKGELCSCDDECRTGHCANGVCCTSSCADKCTACNLPNSLGECNPVPAGALPEDPSQCKASNPGSCGLDGTCDGKGDCRLYLAETVCSFGKCEGDGQSGVKTCDGSGNCSGDVSRPCAPYSCNSARNECFTSCTGTSQCALGQTCSSQSCGMKLNGYKCAGDGECASGHCADGYCCNVACNSPCVSCALPGSYGRCRLVPAGQPDDHCEKLAQDSCGTTGLCDGAGACTMWPADTTPCKTATCSGPTQLTTVAVCDGKGICKEPALVDCSPYRCASGHCDSSCKIDTDCAPGFSCKLGSDGKTGTCTGKKKIGTSCEKADDCDSGHCVDKVCCESSCDGGCRSCSLPGSPGRCTNLPAGARDTRNVCSDKGASSCGQTGLCDGVGGCQVYPAATVCGTSTCDGSNVFTDAPTCTQAGQCVALSTRGCDPFLCKGNTCPKTCTKDSDCVPPNKCENGSCGKSMNGAECSSANQCISGFCSQGVCCNAPCNEACIACNLPGTMGVCAPVADGSPDPQEQCRATDPLGCGTTGTCKGGACAYFDDKTPCRTPSCANSSILHPIANCDGHGKCVAPADQPCGSFLCRNNACLSTCQSDNDCAPPNTCVNNSCGRKPNGAACTSADQCISNFCTEGVCCNSACADGTSNNLCMTCRLNGKVGTCSAVPDGQADPKQRCAATNPATGNCANDGTCNGKGGCRPWSTSVACRFATCVDSSFSSAAKCDGAGNCAPATLSKCDPFMCASDATCLTTCKTNEDCVAGVTCVQSTHRCGNKLPNGQQCAVNSDCNSNICSEEGVCCNATCSQGCKTCATGICTDRLLGAQPRDTTTCVAAPPCGNTGKCDGAGGCQKESPGKVCGEATCAAKIDGTSVGGGNVSEAVAVIPAPKCDGAGTCAAQPHLSCGAYQCAAGACKSSCTNTDADCNSIVPSTADPDGGNSCIMSASSGICQKLPNGKSCSTNAACQYGFCVDSTCCEVDTCADAYACTTDSCATSDGKCSHTINSNSCLIDGVCYAKDAVNPANACQVCAPDLNKTAWSPRSAGTECRRKNGDCDVAEVCDGSGAPCPADGFEPSSKECRASAGTCDVAETCTGSSAACPADAFLASGRECRASAGACDVAETCTGSSAACPADGFEPSSKECRASAGVCDVAETCTGSSAACPADGFESSSKECRASAGACDTAETCTGSSATCPADGFLSNGTTCRAAAGGCDVVETCTGSSAACPADGFVSSGTTCRASAGECDVAETCTGSSAACPTDGFESNTKECRASAGECDVAEMCTGSSASCPADGFVSHGTTCRASAGECDVAEACTGSSAACPADGFLSNGTTCRASAGACDVAEACSGSSAACPADGFEPNTKECRASAGVCDVAEMCTGSSAACPADLKLGSETTCRASKGDCDPAEVCGGSSNNCPADVVLPCGDGQSCVDGTCTPNGH